MKSRSFISWGRRLAYAATAFVLTACAGTMAYKDGNDLIAEGKYEQGLAKLEEASRLDPKNAEFRIAYTNKKLAVINGLNARAESARQQGNLTEAERHYQRILGIDPYNAFAKQGLEALTKERRHKQMVSEAEALYKKGGANNLSDALEKLRPVLSENPAQRDAQNLKARIVEHQAKQKPPEIQLAAAYRKPITLEFRDAPIRSVFDVISRVSGLNFFFDKDVKLDLKATILAKQTPVEDAIRLLLVTNQLEQAVLNENSILIYPNTPQKLKDYQNLVIRSFYLANADVKAVANTIKTMLKTKDMVVDERLGLIFMRDTPEVIRMAERIISLQDLNDPEVMLEVEVMEIKRSRLRELGIRWPSRVDMSIASATAGSTALTLNDVRRVSGNTINVTIPSVTINALKEDSDSNILANPRIRVRNKEKAKILIGDRVPVITTTSTSTGFVSDSVSYVDVGLKLDVEPNIYLDEEVAIKINLEVSNLVREVISKSGTLSYQIGTRNASTVLRLKDGETQVLAGLISDEDRATASKIPGLGELPVLNRIFGSQKDDTQRSEIVLSITPHVIRSVRRPDLMTAEFNSGTESSITSKTLTLGSSEAEQKQADAKPGANPPGSPASTASTAKAAPASAAQNAAQPSAPVNLLSFSWQGPAQVKAGDRFSIALRVANPGQMRALPVVLGFDPTVLQVENVQEGDFLKQSGAQTSFTQRTDSAQGKVFATVVRQNATSSDAAITGTGNVITVNLKALKAAPATKVQLLSATPEPAAANPIAVPVEMNLKVQ